MKLKIKHKITFEQADKLIEKYYDGFTTVEEEKLLQGFFSQAGLRQSTNQSKPFSDISKLKTKPVFSIRPYLRWVGAAAMLVFAVGIQTFAAGYIKICLCGWCENNK